MSQGTEENLNTTTTTGQTSLSAEESPQHPGLGFNPNTNEPLGTPQLNEELIRETTNDGATDLEKEGSGTNEISAKPENPVLFSLMTEMLRKVDKVTSALGGLQQRMVQVEASRPKLVPNLASTTTKLGFTTPVAKSSLPVPQPSAFTVNRPPPPTTLAVDLINC